jgi:hypothetical protein
MVIFVQKTMIEKGQNVAAETSFINKKCFTVAGSWGLHVKEIIEMIPPDTTFNKKNMEGVMDQMEYRLEKMLGYLLAKSSYDLSVDACEVELRFLDPGGAHATISIKPALPKLRVSDTNVDKVSKELRDSLGNEIMKSILKYNSQFGEDAQIGSCELTVAKVH